MLIFLLLIPIVISALVFQKRGGIKNAAFKKAVFVFSIVYIVVSVTLMIAVPVFISPYADYEPSLKIIDEDKFDVLLFFWLAELFINISFAIISFKPKRVLFYIFTVMSFVSLAGLVLLCL